MCPIVCACASSPVVPGNKAPMRVIKPRCGACFLSNDAIPDPFTTPAAAGL